MRQDGLSSPTLFNLYMNDLIVALDGTHVGCHIDGVSINNIRYADDYGIAKCICLWAKEACLWLFVKLKLRETP